MGPNLKSRTTSTLAQKEMRKQRKITQQIYSGQDFEKSIETKKSSATKATGDVKGEQNTMKKL